MINYIFDNTFEGLLTSIYEAFYRYEKPEQILNKLPIQNSLFDTNIIIQTCSEKAIKVYNSIPVKISQFAAEKVYYTFLSELDAAATWIYEYLRLGFRIGPTVDQNLADERIFRIHKLAAKVTKETHLLIGLVRFKLIDENFFYAQIEPDYNILELISPHFVDRMADQNWIIHDLKRKTGAVYNKKDWLITEISEINLPQSGQHELDFQNLWKLYFKSISIENRYNPKLQRKVMPERYWKHLVEK
jgi:probable DNA metabolism protein